MPRLDATVPTDDGGCPTVIVTPEGEGPWAPVVVFMDAGGVRPAMVEIAEHVAAMGYAAVLPELYHRHGDYRPFDAATAFGDPDERDRLMSMVRSVTPATAATDLAGVLAHLDGLDQVDATRVGTTGYCMGGRLSLLAAADRPDRVVAAASFHGGNLAGEGEDSPHRRAGDIRARVVVAAAQDDGSFPPEQAEALEQALTAAGVDHVLETYPAHHGFAVPDMPVYDAVADRRHLQALADLYGATLAR